VRLAALRLMARPAPWHALAKDNPSAASAPASTYEAVPMLPGISTGCPMPRYRSGVSGWLGPKARVAPLRCTRRRLFA
jgi:hypothetical protein